MNLYFLYGQSKSAYPIQKRLVGVFQNYDNCITYQTLYEGCYDADCEIVQVASDLEQKEIKRILEE